MKKIENEKKSNQNRDFAQDKSVDFKEYIKTVDLDDFLRFDEVDHNLDINLDRILGTQDDIYKILRQSIHNENFLLKDVEKKIIEMDNSIEFYRSYIIADRKKKKKKKKVKRIYLTEQVGSDLEEIEEEKEEINEEKTDKEDEEEGEEEEETENLDTEISPSDLNQKAVYKKPNNSNITRKTINGFQYIGFNPKELTELAGFQETPQLLNNLSAKMGFKSSFLRYWNPTIRSEASCAILQDGFWWFFLKYFKKDPQLETDAYKYFCRISDSFVALFMSVDSSIRDRFFGHYAHFLSQAIYMAFYRGFPDSRMLLTDDFKNEICNTVHEWVLGIKPIPESYLDWEIASEINISNNTDIKVTSTGEIIQKINNLEKLLKNLGDKRAHSVKFDKERTPAKPSSPIKVEKRSMSSVEEDKLKFITSFYNKNQSHVVGEGSVLETVSFKLKGQSILIAHYLKIHNIQSDSVSTTISRTQIVKQPSSNEITYKKIIDETIDKAKLMEIEYKKATSQTDIEVKKRPDSSVKLTQNIKQDKRDQIADDLNKTERTDSATSKNDKNGEDLEDF